MCSLCRLPVAKNHTFGQFLTFWELLFPPPFTDEGQICLLEQTQGLQLQTKFKLHVFIVSSCGGQKPQFSANFDIFGSSCLFCRPVAVKNPNFAIFWTSIFLVVSPIGSSPRNLNTGAQLQTFPYPTVSKSFPYPNAFIAKSGAQSLTFESVTNRQTDRQTKNSTFLAAPAADEI